MQIWKYSVIHGSKKHLSRLPHTRRGTLSKKLMSSFLEEPNHSKDRQLKSAKEGDRPWAGKSFQTQGQLHSSLDLETQFCQFSPE